MPVELLDAFRPWRKTRIIATIGPASNDEKTIGQLIDAGVDIFRLNMSHGTHHDHKRSAGLIRRIADEKDSNIAILVDLCGPKIRVGKFSEGSISVEKDQKLWITCDKHDGEGDVSCSYGLLADDVGVGERIYIDDGRIELVVRSVKSGRIECVVVNGGVIKDNKGINLPDSNISIESFTEKDRFDTDIAIEIGADFIALSFVRSAADIKKLKDYLYQCDSDIPVIAKIEKPEALKNIDEILEESFGIMVARGDLGIELPAERVPLVQEELVLKARTYCRPVIVATQMLESMIDNPKPTRAEVGDVASAAMSSADAVMLSAETASGAYPVKAVKMMDVILREIEDFQFKRGFYKKLKNRVPVIGQYVDRHAVAKAATRLVKDLGLKAIVIPTRSGTTSRVIAASRPLAPLLGICSSNLVLRRMQLCWGVVPIKVDGSVIKDWKKLCQDISGRCKIKIENHSVLLVSGFTDDGNSEPVIKIINL